jgi:hypothetical protein
MRGGGFNKKPRLRLAIVALLRSSSVIEAVLTRRADVDVQAASVV